MNEALDSRETLLQIYQQALQAVQGWRCTLEQLSAEPVQGPLCLVAIGKAAASMAAGARQALGEGISQGLVITKHGHGDPLLPFETIESGHPLPDGESLRAGARLLQVIEACPPGRPFLFLLSGGASALVELLPEGLGLQQLQQVNDWLLGSGLDIEAMNRVRKGLSLLKGGRLARYLVGHPVHCLLISDVPGDRLEVIGSGPLLADRAAAAWQELSLPPWLQALMQQVPPAPTADEPCLQGIEHRLVASNGHALDAAEAAAEALGLEVHRHAEPIRGEAEAMAARVVEALEQTPGLHLWGGESTVRLPPEPGRGGRNQHLALCVAQRIAGREGYWVLVGASDGSDGPTEDAGALVDGHSLARGDLHYRGGAAAALQAFDAGSYLQGGGDLLYTGPTGTNVMDLILAWRRC